MIDEQRDEFSHNRKPLLRAMRNMNGSELKLATIGGVLFSLAGLLDLLA